MTEREIFLEAIDLTGADARAAYLLGACGKDVTLRRKVEELLQEHFARDGLLTKPAVDGRPTITSGPVLEGLGSQIGRYKLLQKLGEGGFGIVYMAEQKEPVKRRVAFKIIKLGMDTKNVVARFEAERQALAMMDHPNIAKVLDAGATDTGRPFFVMELVKGVPITRYCDDNSLTTQERLELFLPVCQAIQHAHQKGVIHRDIKPSNVMVTLHDGVPMPKVIDFGIAKATQQELTEKTIFTEYNQLIGTPAYMSPEQAEMNGLDIDTRSDIYSLGVLLYELLVGRTPLDSRELMGGGYDEIRRRIKEEDPLRPSNRVSTLEGEEKTTVAKRRKVGADQLSGELRGDLDWIVMKCLEKERGRRYETANGLAADLKRYLTHEPVVARPPNAAYRFRKAWQRNKLAFTAAGAIALALILGTGASTWQAVRANRAQRIAEMARAAETEQRVMAQGKQKEAETQQQRADREAATARRTAYNASISSIQADWEKRNYRRVRETLAGQKDYPEHSFEWLYWQRMTHLELSSFSTYANGIRTFSLSPDGKKIVLVMNDDSIEVRSLPAGEKLATFLGHTEYISNAAFSPDGRVIASCGGPFFAGVIKLWNAETGAEIRSFGQSSDAVGLDQSVGNRQYALTFSPDGRFLITGGAHGKNGVQLWEVATGKKLRTYEEGNDNLAWITQLAFSNDGKRILCNAQKTLRLYDVETGKQLATIGGETEATRDTTPSIGFSLSPDSRRLAVFREKITIYDLAAEGFSKVLLEISDQLPGTPDQLSFSPDGKRLVAGVNGDSVIYDAFAGEYQLTIRGGSYGSQFLADSQRVISTDGDRRIKIWDTSSYHELVKVTTGYLPLAIARDGSRLIVLLPKEGMEDKLARERNTGGLGIVDTTSGKLLTQMREHEPGHMDGAAFSPNGQWVASGGRDTDGTFRVWDATTGKVKLMTRTPRAEHYSIGFGPNGDTIISRTEQPIRGHAIWDISTGKEIHSPRTPIDERPWAITSDGRRLAFGDSDGNVRIWDADSGEELRKWKAHEGQQFESFMVHANGCIDYSADGRHLVTGGFDGLVKMWDPATGKLEQSFLGHSDKVVGVRFTPDQRRLLSQSTDGTVRLWDPAMAKELLALTDPLLSGLWTCHVAMSRDGRRIFAAPGHRREIVIWEGATTEQVAAWRQEEEADASLWAAEQPKVQERLAAKDKLR